MSSMLKKLRIAFQNTQKSFILLVPCEKRTNLPQFHFRLTKFVDKKFRTKPILFILKTMNLVIFQSIKIVLAAFESSYSVACPM